MALTADDILNKEFDKKFRGYDPDQVNDYLDVIVAEIDRLTSENHGLRQELDAAKEKNAYFAQLQDSLNSSIVVAQEAADRLKQNARKEAELILYEAEREANDKVHEANVHAQNIITETEALRRSSRDYREKIEKMIRYQLGIVTNEKYKELFNTTSPQTIGDLEDRPDIGVKTAEKMAELAQDTQADFDQAQALEPILDSSPDLGDGDAAPQSASPEQASPDQEKPAPSSQTTDSEIYTDRSQEGTDQDNDQDGGASSSDSIYGQTIRIQLPGEKD